MQHVAHPVRDKAGTHSKTSIVVAALVALAAAVAVVLVLAIDSNRSAGPEEERTSHSTGAGTQVAASRPDESKVAAAISTSDPTPATRPDESDVAAAVTARHSTAFSPLPSDPVDELRFSSGGGR